MIVTPSCHDKVILAVSPAAEQLCCCAAVQAQRANLQKKLEERQADLEAKKAALSAVRAGEKQPRHLQERAFESVWYGNRIRVEAAPILSAQQPLKPLVEAHCKHMLTDC